VLISPNILSEDDSHTSDHQLPRETITTWSPSSDDHGVLKAMLEIIHDLVETPKKSAWLTGSHWLINQLGFLKQPSWFFI
jgi:hypothetical protein